MGFVSSLISGIAGGISARQTNKTNLKIARETNAANLALAREQNDWNLAQWNRENEYNSPANQVALLKAAGLNPNLYAGEGSTAGQLVSADLANQQLTSVQNPLPISDIVALAGISKLDAERKNIEADTDNKRSDANLKDEQALTEMSTRDLKKQLMAGQIEIGKSVYLGNMKKLDWTDQQIEESKAVVKSTLQSVEESKSRIAKINSDMALNDANIDLIDERMRDIIVRRGMDQEKQRELFELWDVQKDKMRAEAAKARQEGREVQLRNFFNSDTMVYRKKDFYLDLSMKEDNAAAVKAESAAAVDFAYWRAGMGVVTDFVDCLSDAANIADKLTPKKSVTKRRYGKDGRLTSTTTVGN